MANSENLIPFDKRTESEQREIRSAGGRASGRARRRTARLRETMNRLLTMKVDAGALSDVLISDGGESTYEEVVTMAMIQEAMNGNVKAYNAIMATVGQTDKSEEDLEEQRIRTERAKRARDQEVGSDNEENDNIASFLKAMNPSGEELENLFEESEADAKEAEEAGEV
mgnify:CR=1 FL=1